MGSKWSNIRDKFVDRSQEIMNYLSHCKNTVRKNRDNSSNSIKNKIIHCNEYLSILYKEINEVFLSTTKMHKNTYKRCINMVNRFEKNLHIMEINWKIYCSSAVCTINR